MGRAPQQDMGGEREPCLHAARALPSLVLNGLLFIAMFIHLSGYEHTGIMTIIVNDRCPKDKLSQVLIVESPEAPMWPQPECHS